MKLPWVKWFPTDWLSDSELAKTSLLGRGLWAEALNAMYNSDTYALSGTPEELSRVLRCTVAEFHASLGDLAKHHAANIERRNGVVTLVSRRLERLYKSRQNGALRVSRYRVKQRCNAETPSASASASDSSKEKGVQGERERTRGYPLTVDSAIKQCALCAIPREFVEHCFDKAESRGGCDSKQIPITNFPAYVRTEWKYEQDRKGREQAQESARKPWQSPGKKMLTPMERTLKQALSNYKP